MFSQFFGHYLLNNNIVTNVQLNDALAKKSETRVKLGVLAINQGYMTANQVDQVHQQQMKVDKRIGDIAVDMGFLTPTQIDELLASQKSAHLLLGQTLVDLGYMSNSLFESALIDYKAKYQLEDSDFIDESADKTNEVVASFLLFDELDSFEFLVDYTSLLFKSLTRFITDEFTPLVPSCVSGLECDLMVMQNINGEFSANSGIIFTADSLVAFASKYAKEDITVADDYAEAVVSEFLNLHNGLFAVNISSDRDIELSLSPQIIEKNISVDTDKLCVVLPISFTFGEVSFVISLT